MTEQQFNLLPESLKTGYQLLESGEVPNYSTGTCGCTTSGFGKLDDYGYFEHPLSMSEDDDVYLTLEQYLED